MTPPTLEMMVAHKAPFGIRVARAMALTRIMEIAGVPIPKGTVRRLWWRLVWWWRIWRVRGHSAMDARERALAALSAGYQGAQAADSSDFATAAQRARAEEAIAKFNAELDEQARLHKPTWWAQAIPGHPIPEDQEPEEPK